ncbi:MAG: hypothetical protein RIT02_2442 [Planctomycetota bacterium]|jgi:hypothetical protein
MIPNEQRQQIDRWLDGDLSESEAEAVICALQESSAALQYFADRAVLEQMLVGCLTCVPVSARGQVISAAVPGRLAESAGGAAGWIRGWKLRTWVWATSAVLCSVLLSVVWLLPAVAAGPSELVRQTLAEYQPAMDRCYAVQVQPDVPQWRSAGRRRLLQSASTLWVRDHSFVQEFRSQDQQLTWGRDAEGAVWFTIGGRSAAVFMADEVPAVLQEVCDLRTLQLPTLLETLLRDYDLKYGVQEGGLSTILARRRAAAGISKYGAAEIRIESANRLVRHVLLERIEAGRVVALLDFSLQDVRPQPDGVYELRTHLQTDAVVLDRGSRAGARAELLRNFLQLLRNVSVDLQRGQMR